MNGLDPQSACAERSDELSAARPPAHEPGVGAIFADAEERERVPATLAEAGMVVVRVDIGASAQGRLADVVDEAVERALGARGAAAPGIVSSSDRDATLSDQLFRARRAGATGIAVVLGPLRAAASAAEGCAALEPSDSAFLSFLAGASRERPLALVLDARDAETAGYGAPIPLRKLLPRGDCDPVPAEVPEVSPTPAPAARHTAGASVVEREEPWRAWTLQLSAARGPQPLSALERLFTESYMPLNHAIGSGLEDPRARHAHDEFAGTFAKGYTEAFTMFAATTKRPRMVLDAHDVAARIARLHGARSTRLLLVDAMRWDVSRIVQERLVAMLGARASLTDELLLWSALPTTTMRQLETIARGVEALRAPAPLEGEPELPRGRTAEYVRRMRVGPRELSKLDLLEARLQSSRGRVLAALPEMALATAEAVARHVETLQARTLLLVFGDHGFTIDRSGIARQGGASPEEVLVGAFALLVGDVH
jgi:hypothetical protein